MQACIVFRNGKGSFTQCILGHTHKGPWRILRADRYVGKKKLVKWYSLAEKA